MVRRTYPQRTLVEVLLPDADTLWDPVLRQIDLVLEDEDLVDQVTAALRRRHPLSARRGRLGTPAAVVLRMLVLKHLFDWSFDECERDVRGSLVYRAFCRIDGERVPDAKGPCGRADRCREPTRSWASGPLADLAVPSTRGRARGASPPSSSEMAT